MAYTTVQSGEIPEGTQYYSGKLPLGDYNFYLKIDATGVSPKIVAQCESPDGEVRTAASRTWPAGTHVLQWSVEANETEASVFVSVVQRVDIGNIESINQSTLCTATDGSQFHTYASPHGMLMLLGNTLFKVFATDSPGQSAIYTAEDGTSANWPMNQTYTANGKTVYYVSNSASWRTRPTILPQTVGSDPKADGIAWKMVYGDEMDYVQSKLIARFAINLGDAGGYPGGGGGWTQPGDWNPTPTTTLQMTVNGALSGRHNDPLHDTNYSYLPAGNTAEAGYGCGGDGGHGGGGGAGASTIIVRQFATNRANSKNILALAKRHGYGSGGGKGGQGGDGCILIYY